MIFIIITGYIFGSILYRLTHKDKFKDIFNWEEPLKMRQTKLEIQFDG